MPPRVKLPHGLTRSPFDMSRGELEIAALLATSVGIGLYQLATSPWGEREGEELQPPSSSPTIRSEQRDRTPRGSLYGQSSSSNGMTSFPGTQPSPTVLEVTEDFKVKRRELSVDDGITKVGETLSSPKVNDGITEVRFGEPKSSSLQSVP